MISEELKSALKNVDSETQYVFFIKLLYELNGFDGFKDFVLFGINRTDKKEKLVAFNIVFSNKEIKELFKTNEEKIQFNALLKLWLDELEKNMRIEIGE